MKNKTFLQHLSSALLLCLAVSGIGYYAVLQIKEPSVIGFSLVWLASGVFFLYAGCRRFFGKPLFRKKLSRKTGFAVAAAAFMCACLCAVMTHRICTPVIADGSERPLYLFVLGGGITRKGTLGRIPKARIEAAALYLKTHEETKAVVSGGTGKFMPCAEAPVLAAYLAELGIPQERIIQEDKAKDTIENFIFGAECAAADSGIKIETLLENPLVIITSWYHLARAELLARRLGFSRVSGIAAKTSPLFTVNAFAREICAWIKLYIRIFLTGRPSRSDLIEKAEQ